MVNDLVPSFGSWLTSTREDLGLSITEFAQLSGLPRGTTATLESKSRRDSRPRLTVLTRMAAALNQPILGVAAVAGTVTGRGTDLLTDPVFERVRQARNDWGSPQGGALLATIREARGTSVERARQRWNDTWAALPLLSVDAWYGIEEGGHIPENWRHISHVEGLRELPGSWILALVRAVLGNTVDALGVLFVMGGISHSQCIRLQAESDYEQLADIFQAACQGPEWSAESFYRGLLAIAWTIPPRAPIPSASAAPTPVATDGRLESLVWAHLEQQCPGMRTIPHDAILARIVQTWAELTPDTKQQILHLLDHPSRSSAEARESTTTLA